ncbi:hypothetical protein [Paenibacillus sp. N3.4]|uniref:hypothetical protein n=1 Tax=Paenibacillus sp. N3.4 TaxID=2603222 RepID=UPI00164F7009|nr:hypothetical protein [Paenibacillus sp. N3.4]
MVDHVFALMGWIVGFGSCVGGVVAAIAHFVRVDSTQYDREFLWNFRYSLEELELNKAD